MHLLEPQVQAFFEYSPDAIVLIDSGGRIVLDNPRIQQLFGYDPDELLGLPMEALLAENLQDRRMENRFSFISNPQPRRLVETSNLYARRKYGWVLSVNISLAPVETEEGILTVLTVSDDPDMAWNPEISAAA